MARPGTQILDQQNSSIPSPCPWSSLVEGDEQPNRPHVKKWCTCSWSNFFNFMDWVAYWWSQYGCSSPSAKVLHVECYHKCAESKLNTTAFHSGQYYCSTQSIKEFVAPTFLFLGCGVVEIHLEQCDQIKITKCQ